MLSSAILPGQTRIGSFGNGGMPDGIRKPKRSMQTSAASRNGLRHMCAGIAKKERGKVMYIAIIIGIISLLLVRRLVRKPSAAAPHFPERPEEPKPEAVRISEPVRINPANIPAFLRKEELAQAEPKIVVLPKAWSVEEAEAKAREEDEAFADIDEEKERKRLERVLEGLYNKRDKYEYMGKSHNTQAWKGLEYDIMSVERRLKYFSYEA